MLCRYYHTGFVFRFAPENFTERHAAAFMPFGVGNRLCIGNRLALLEMKVTVAVVLKQFSIEKTSATPVSEYLYYLNVVVCGSEVLVLSQHITCVNKLLHLVRILL